MLSKNQIKEIQLLHLKKHRDAKKWFIVEGIKSVVEVLRFEPTIISKLFVTKEFLIDHIEEIQNFKIIYFEITEEELKKISLQNNPNHVLAICNYLSEATNNFDFKNAFTFYLDDIRDPGNFGTIIRLADWYGIKKIICSPECCDIYNPKVIQATMGAFMRVQVIYVELKEFITQQACQVIYGAVLNGKNIYKENLTSGLIVIGNEANGINEANLKIINLPITIPSHQANGTESLNAAIATAIIASEFYRQLKIK